jgi:hypothetical protein
MPKQEHCNLVQQSATEIKKKTVTEFGDQTAAVTPSPTKTT